jgi:hypothetical protein
MTTLDPNTDWHDQGITWTELKVGLALSLSVALAVLLLF